MNFDQLWTLGKSFKNADFSRTKKQEPTKLYLYYNEIMSSVSALAIEYIFMSQENINFITISWCRAH